VTITTPVDRDARYQQLYGTLGGYLPADREALHAWHLELKAAVQQSRVVRAASVVEREAPGVPPAPPRWDPAVEALAQQIESSGVLRMLVTEMIDEVPADKRVIENVSELLNHLDFITRLAPRWESDPTKRIFFPMSALFAEMMMDRAGEDAFRYPPFNDAIRAILGAWCRYLDSSASRHVLNTGPNGWLCSDAYKYNQLQEFVIPDPSAPYWGWESYNAFFHREIKAAERPIAAPNDPKVIVSPNDGTLYRIARNVQATDSFWLKGEPYSLRDMLGGTKYLGRFVGGWVFQSYLSGADYHRFHAPVDGKVLDAVVVDGLMFSNLVNDISGVASQAYYTAVNTRGLTFIQADDPAIGVVCVMPVGITEISSMTLTARPGTHVRKGDELGFFSFGGSTVAVLFEPTAIKRFVVSAPADHPLAGRQPVTADAATPVQVLVNSAIAQAN
jgi:phosphatidylserine decarboxylase